METSVTKEERQALLKTLIEEEYALFSAVHNIGQRADCQDNTKMFTAMRAAQFSVWSTDSLRLWQADLEDAKKAGRNLFADKYAYMMASTRPCEFAALRTSLPELSEAKKDLVERYIRQFLQWAAVSWREHPHFRAAGRPLYTTDDSTYVTSQETYMRGELCTYSEQTLQSLLADCERAAAAGRNLEMAIDDAIARVYGYASAADYEQQFS